MLAYPYRLFEEPMDEIKDVKESTRIKEFMDITEVVRAPSSFSLGCHVDGCAYPQPDMRDNPTKLAGVLKRFTFRPPEPIGGKLEGLANFVKRWCVTNIPPLPSDCDVTFENWIEKVPYPAWRKNQLRQLHSQGLDPYDKQYWTVKAFIKDEKYPSFKHARAINSRHDLMKITLGPYFKAIEKELFLLPWFIKKISIDERPRYIMERLAGAGTFVATDYTAFESLFTSDIMLHCEFILYEYMLSSVDRGTEILELMKNVLTGTNQCKFKGLTVSVEATRMSGEMNTSLGNSFSNLMFFLYLCELNQAETVGVVEGDDGLFRVNGRVPSKEDFLDLGLVIKLEEHSQLNTASFCGLVFDTEDLINVADPHEFLCNVGWSNPKYLFSRRGKQLALLRCKALSAAHQYPGCPIISTYAHSILRLTASVDVRWVLESSISGWERDQLVQAFSCMKKLKLIEPPLRTRRLVEELYGYTVERQIEIETTIKTLNLICPIPYGWVNPTPQQEKYFTKYCFEVSTRSDPNCSGITYSRSSAYEALLVQFREHIRYRKLAL